MSEANPITSGMELAGKAVALGATFSLASSLVYDWGFFSALSLTFLEIPSTLSDHVRSALIWFPKIIASFGAIVVFELLTRRLERGMTEEEIVQSSQNPERTRKFRNGPLWFMAYGSVFAVAGYILAGAVFMHALPLSLCILWFVFSAWAQSHPRILIRRPFAFRVAAHFLPPVMIWLYFAGYTEAVRLYDTTAPQAKLTTASSIDTVVLLRHLERGVLVKETSDSVAFRPWSEIKKLETAGKYTPAQGILCVWFHVACIPQPKATP